MSLLHDTMRRTYAAQRGVSQGAHITLAASSGGYTARFECATRAASILGSRNLSGDPKTPVLLIPTEDLHRSITKLAETFSIALVDTVTDDQGGTRFALVWKIMPTKAMLPALLDDAMKLFTEKANQGNEVNLDEY